MPGLIPLMLKPTTATNRPSSNRTSTEVQPLHTRCLSADTIQTRRAQALPKRLSHQPQPVSPPPVLPATSAEWKRTIAEIKEQHLNKRYRACSARCAEILSNIKDESQIEPAYLIYLHFYAAASMEMCTRPLPLTSPYRTSILHQARTHYDRASSLISAAEDSVATKTRSNSVSSSRSSSLHSPASSISSRTTYTADTSISSPASSVYSFDDFRTKSALASPKRPGTAPKRVKKVSFSLPLSAKEEEEEREEKNRLATFRFPEPIVRPDSPTLGFDDDYFQAGAALRALPEPPKQDPPPLAEAPRIEEELPLRPEEDDDVTPVQVQEFSHDDIFRVERSVHRYNETLTHLRSQLASHADNVQTQLALTPIANSSSRPSSPASWRFPSSPVSPRFPVSPTSNSSSISSSPVNSRFPTPYPASPTPGARSRNIDLDKQERIERLRANGWRRKRFDPRRYEDLAKEVLAELE